MVAGLVLLLLLAASVSGAHGLLLTPIDGAVVDCDDPFYISCSRVSVDFEGFKQNELLLQIPENISLMKKKEQTLRFEDKSKIISFKNPLEKAEAVFVLGETSSGQPWISGSLNWARAGRHFQLSGCKHEAGCFIWAEVDQDQWTDDPSFWDLHDDSEEIDLSEEQLQLLELGRTDRESEVEVSITVHVTESFRKSFDYSQILIQAWMDLAFAETNEGYFNSKIPIKVKLHCIVNSKISDDIDLHVMMDDFKKSAHGDTNKLRRGADIAVLMTAIDADVCGVGKVDSIGSGNTLAVMKKSCAVGYYSLGHEMGHMYGCYHNREEGKVNLDYPNAYGFLMRPPVESGLRTILAYTADGYKTRINAYSGVDVFFDGVPTGNGDNSNAYTIVERRFLMANVGDEELSCDA